MWIRRRGDILRSQQYDDTAVRRLRSKTKYPDFQTLYQQDPSDLDDPISPADFRRFKNIPFSRVGTVTSIDWATSENAPRSYSVAQVWQRMEGNFYLRYQWRARVEYGKLCSKVCGLMQRYGCSVVLVEGGTLAAALSHKITSVLGKIGPSIKIIPTKNRSKTDRFNDVKGLIKEGRVLIPESADWVHDFLAELVAFPDGDDDQVDALSQALGWLNQDEIIPPPPPRAVGAIASSRGGIYVPRGGPYVFWRRR